MVLCALRPGFLRCIFLQAETGAGVSRTLGEGDKDSIFWSLCKHSNELRPLSLSLPPPLRHPDNHLPLWKNSYPRPLHLFGVFTPSNPFVSVESSPPPPSVLSCSLHPRSFPSANCCRVSLLSQNPLASLPPSTLMSPFTSLRSSLCSTHALL